MIYWFTGQPGAGKTTLARQLKDYLFPNNTIIVDGDDIRDIFQNKDYSETGRRKNIEKAQDISLFLNSKGFDVIVSLVSPYKDQRDEFKNKHNVLELEKIIMFQTMNHQRKILLILIQLMLPNKNL